MSEKSPAFQFYPSDFLSDKNTMLMSAEEIGAYMLLMCVCWREGSLPDDMEEMALLSRMDGTAFEHAWEKRISACFIMNDHGEWVHPRLEKEREKQQKYKQKKAKAGRKGAQSRWGNTDNSSETDKNGSANNKNGSAINENGTATNVPMAKDSSSSSSSSSSSDSKPYSAEFEQFWELYDKKKGKKKAWLEWKKLSEAEHAQIMDNVPVFLTHFSDEQYTPYPRKYLYNRYWEDEDFQEPKHQSKNQSNGKRPSKAESFFRKSEGVLKEFQ